MANINLSQEIRNRIEEICGDQGKFYVAPDIPEKKLNNALKSIVPTESPNFVIALIDTTVFGTSKEGVVFFSDKFAFKELLSTPVQIEYSQIEKVSFNEVKKVDAKGKEKIERNMLIGTENTNYQLSGPVFDYINGYSLENFLQIIIELNCESDEDEKENAYIKEDQLMPLELLDEQIKLCYVKILCNYALSSGDVIDSEEYSEIISFIVKINMTPENRIKLRGYMLSNSNIEDTSILLERLEFLSTDEEINLVKKSLMKDVLNIYKINNDLINWKEDRYLLNLASTLEVTKEEISLFVETIQRNEDIISQRLDDTQITKSLKDLSAKAVAVGVPMAALYFSGTVGVSAVGMTSGLAALGMGGVMGFSSMFTGVGTIALIGVGAYQGMKKVTGMKDLENNKQREKLLQEIIKNSQQTLNVIIEDVNTMSKMLIDEIENGKETQVKIKKLAEIIGMLSKGAENVNSKINFVELETIITKIPKKIDEARLVELTDVPTLYDARDFVLNCYTEDIYELREDLDLVRIQKLYDLLKQIGYLNLKDASVASVKSGAKRLLKDFWDKP